MNTKPPPDRRRFDGRRDEMDYLQQKLLYWLYEREDRGRALPFADRLGRLLAKTAADDGAIFREECRSLICEARGDLRSAIRHRENEIRLIHRLHAIARDKAEHDLFTGLYGYDDLSDRLDLLAVLYRDNGELAKAIDTLRESKRLCKAHAIKFDGDDVLREYLIENQQDQAPANGAQTGKSNNSRRIKAQL